MVSVSTLDQSGTNAQFTAGSSSEVVFAIGLEGKWSFSIDGVQEAIGVVPEGFDLNKDYHVAVFGQDDNGGGKEIESLTLESAAPDGPDPYTEFLYYDAFDGDGLDVNRIKGGGLVSVGDNGASWDDDGLAVYENGGTNSGRSALMYSENSFRSGTGF